MVRRIKNEEENNSKIKEIIGRKSKEFNASNKKVRSALYASDIYQCPRKVFYQFFPDIYATEQIDGRTARIFANGEDVHMRLSAYLDAERSIEFEREINIPRDELDVHGRCDGVAIIDTTFCVVEFKSINKDKMFEPKDEHAGQLQWYLGMWEMHRLNLREEFGIAEEEMVFDPLILKSEKTGRTGYQLSSVEKKLLRATRPVMGEVVYECKPNQEIYGYEIEFDEAKFEELKSWYREVKKAVDEGIRPTVHYDKNKYPCNWWVSRCSYYDICWGEQQVETDHLIKIGRVKKIDTGDEADKMKLLLEAIEQSIEGDEDDDEG
jgi:CRISPR/Cas system-associated exonuclease Cas4 (RecB family)